MGFRRTFDQAVRNQSDPAKVASTHVALLRNAVENVNKDGDFAAEIIGYDRYDGFRVRLTSADGAHCGTVFLTPREMDRARPDSYSSSGHPASVAKLMIEKLAIHQRESAQERHIVAALQAPPPQPPKK